MMPQKVLNLLAATLLSLLLFTLLFGQAGATNPNTNAAASPSGTPPASTTPPNASAPAGPFSFAEPTLRLPAGVPDGTADIILRSSTKQTAPPTVKDVELPLAAATVTFREPVQDSKASPNTWRVPVTVNGLAPATSQQRYALVTYEDKKTQYLLYTLTNQAAGSFSWSVSKPPDPWVVSDGNGGCTAFTVTAKDAATDLKVFSTLVEQTTKEAITLDSLRLCPADNKCDGTQPINLDANVPTNLQLCTTKGFHGKYDGSVVLASRQKPDGDTVLQHAQFSSVGAKTLGFFLILGGVLLAFVAKVWARARLERNQALMPAALMRSQVAALREALDQLDTFYRNVPVKIRASIEKLIDELSDTTLDKSKFLPPAFPNPFGFQVDAAGYKAYLEARNPRLQLLSILVNDGVVGAAQEDDGSLSPTKKELVKAAIQNIDAISTTDLTEAQRQVKLIIDELHSALTGQPIPETAAESAVTVSRSLESLQLEIQNISIAIWLLYGILTALSGLAVLILNNPGYGVPLDYVYALFWGFGLPTVVTQLTPSSAATALNISVARS